MPSRYATRAVLGAAAALVLARPPLAAELTVRPQLQQPTGQVQTTYRYTVRTAQRAARQGAVDAGGIQWTCKAAVCTASGPWPKPGVEACRALADRVGRITEYGHAKRKLDAGALKRCNAAAKADAPTRSLAHRGRKVTSPDATELSRRNPAPSSPSPSASGQSEASGGGLAAPGIDAQRNRELLDEARERIPRHAPEWSNPSESDSETDRAAGKLRLGDGPAGARPPRAGDRIRPELRAGAERSGEIDDGERTGGDLAPKPGLPTRTAPGTNDIGSSAASGGSGVAERAGELAKRSGPDLTPRRPGGFLPDDEHDESDGSPPPAEIERGDGTTTVRLARSLTITGLGDRDLTPDAFTPRTVTLSDPLTITGLGDRDLTPDEFDPVTVEVPGTLTVTGTH